jgi:3-oxoadipate enol-lactonase
VNVVAADGARIACRIDGPSERTAHPETIVFANSLGTNLLMWEPQCAPFGRRMRVVRYDGRGHGESQVTPGPYTIGLLGQDLLAVLDGLGLERVHLCGLSLGGMVALWVAAHHPERVERAVFCNTAARIGTVEGWNERISAVSSGGMAAIRDTVLARFLSSNFRARRPEVARAIGDMVAGTSPEGYEAACAALRDADVHAILPKIRARSLVICSEWDGSTPVKQGEELHTAIPGSRLVVLKEAAHLSNVEQADSFNTAATSFLEQGEMER